MSKGTCRAWGHGPSEPELRGGRAARVCGDSDGAQVLLGDGDDARVLLGDGDVARSLQSDRAEQQTP